MSRLFNGTSDRLEAAISTLPMVGPYTVSAWCKPATITTNRAVLGYGQSGAATYYTLFHNTSAFGQFERAVAAAASDSTGAAVNNGVWNHLAATVTGTQPAVCYVNGVAGTSDATAKTLVSLTTFDVGALLDSGSYIDFYSGRIGEVAIWNVALSAAQVSSLNAGVNPTSIQPGPLIYWQIKGAASPEPYFPGYGSINLTVTGTTPEVGDDPPVQPPSLWTPPPAFQSRVTLARGVRNRGDMAQLLEREPVVLPSATVNASTTAVSSNARAQAPAASATVTVAVTAPVARTLSRAPAGGVGFASTAVSARASAKALAASGTVSAAPVVPAARAQSGARGASGSSSTNLTATSGRAQSASREPSGSFGVSDTITAVAARASSFARPASGSASTALTAPGARSEARAPSGTDASTVAVTAPPTRSQTRTQGGSATTASSLSITGPPARALGSAPAASATVTATVVASAARAGSWAPVGVGSASSTIGGASGRSSARARPASGLVTVVANVPAARTLTRAAPAGGLVTVAVSGSSGRSGTSAFPGSATTAGLSITATSARSGSSAPAGSAFAARGSSMSQGLLQLIVTSDHVIPLDVLGDNATLYVLAGGPVYFGDSNQVSPTSNQGSVSALGQQTFLTSVWVAGTPGSPAYCSVFTTDTETDIPAAYIHIPLRKAVVTATPNATPGVLGLTQTVAPSSPYFSFSAEQVSLISSGSFGSETLTVNLIFVFSDSSTQSFSTTFTSAGTIYDLTGGNLNVNAYKDDLFLVAVDVNCKSSIGSSAASVTATISARNG